MKYPASFALSKSSAILTSRFVSISVLLTCAYVFTAFAQVPIPIVTPAPSPTPAPPLLSRETDAKGAPSEYIYMRTSGAAHFTNEATKLGQRGYRLMSVSIASNSARITGGSGADRYQYFPVAAIFKLDPGNTYEYDWFEAEVPGEIVTRLGARAKEGFYYYKEIAAFDDSACGSSGYSSSDQNDSFARSLQTIHDFLCWTQGAVFFLERKNGEKIERDYRVNIGKLGWGKNSSAEMEASLNNTGQMGYRPVGVGKMKVDNNYAFFAVVEKEKGAPEVPIKEQYKFMKTEFKFTKRVNAAAQEGYRLKFTDLFIAHKYAVLEKADDRPTSYIWTDAYGKTHEAEIAAAVAAGSRVAMVSREAGDLIFEVIPGAKYDYKLLQMNSPQKKPTKKDPNPVPAKTMDEILAEFDALLNDGYIIRDIMYAAGGPRILFERKK